MGTLDMTNSPDWVIVAHATGLPSGIGEGNNPINMGPENDGGPWTRPTIPGCGSGFRAVSFSGSGSKQSKRLFDGDCLSIRSLRGEMPSTPENLRTNVPRLL